jgi:hypothetical protein
MPDVERERGKWREVERGLRRREKKIERRRMGERDGESWREEGV